ncbi:hypothetical protein OF83DRAFT_1102297 [Amylostereum chailletii]|nr:hypothetical protein OF83DRAFT_1102297 [Amylostereum chailletii]
MLCLDEYKALGDGTDPFVLLYFPTAGLGLPFIFTMFASLATLVFIAGSAVSVSAQNISSQCQSAILGIATSSEGECINAAGLTGFVPALSNGNTSLVSPLNTWLKGLCSQQACTNDQLASLVNDVASGCSTDLASLGLNNDSISEVTATVQQYYPTARQLVCLKNNTSTDLCVTDLLNTVQDSVGTLSANSLPQIVLQIIGGGIANSSLPLTPLCTNCGKQAYNILNTNFPSTFDSNAKTAIQGECGANFTNGANVSDVSQTAAGLSTSNSDGAFASFPVSSLAVSLVTLASAFVVFA